MSDREVRRFVDDLLAGRRTRPVRASLEDRAELRTAITLRAARPGSGAPTEDFLAELHRQLTAEAAEVAPARPGRRLFIQGASIAAAAAAVGAVGDRVVSDDSAGAPLADPALSPTAGQWRSIAASGDVVDGSVRSFDLGAVIGFVYRKGDRLAAVSGICTHQGCRLVLDAPTRQLDCPCHRTVFALTGELVRHQLPVAPAPLPELEVRDADGDIQVFSPPPGD